METEKLFMLLLGCRPKGRFTEQHDVYFGIGRQLNDLIPGIRASWQGAGEIHIDAWRAVTCVDGYSITVVAADADTPAQRNKKAADLFFINLGGYKANEFEEIHYKMLVVAASPEMARNTAKKAAFFKHFNLANSENNKNASGHIDDKYGIDIDDACSIRDILTPQQKELYSITIAPNSTCSGDAIHLGYLRLKDT